MRAILGGVMLLVVTVGAAAQQGDPGERVGPASWVEIDPGWKHLKLGEFWDLYPYAPMLGDTPPFVVAVDRRISVRSTARRDGFRVTHENLGRFLATPPGAAGPVASPAAAAEVLAFALQADVVPDQAALDRLLATTARLAKVCPDDYVATKVRDHRPAACGLTATPEGTGYRVRGVVLETKALFRISEVSARVETDGRVAARIQPDRFLGVERTEITWGPPEHWQTEEGPIDPDDAAAVAKRDAWHASQDAQRAHVERVRHAYAVALDPRRTLDAIRRACTPQSMMDDIRRALGAPDRDVGSGIHIWVYDLHDGTATIFGDSGRGPLMYVHHVDRAERDAGGLCGPMRTLADLTPR